MEKPKITLQEILPGQGNAIENLIHLFSQHNNNNNNFLQKHFSGGFFSFNMFLIRYSIHQRHSCERMQEKHGFNVQPDTKPLFRVFSYVTTRIYH